MTPTPRTNADNASGFATLASWTAGLVIGALSFGRGITGEWPGLLQIVAAIGVAAVSAVVLRAVVVMMISEDIPRRR